MKWNPVPLPFIHGQPRGFRIHINQLDQDSMANTTSPNVTSFDYKNLQALTNYSISVLAFNDAGDGPYSRVYVKTMPQSKSNNTPVSRSINTAVHNDHRFICTGLASFKSKSFVKVNNNAKNVQVEQY